MPKLFLLWAVWLSCSCPSRMMTGVSALPINGVMESSNFDQLGSLVREYLKIMENVRTQPKVISGQVNLRAPRSELGDMAHALKLYQLQELDRTFGSKSRPRFGKRNEVIGQNDVPGYGYYGYEEPSYENTNTAANTQRLIAGDEHELQQQQQERQQKRR